MARRLLCAVFIYTCTLYIQASSLIQCDGSDFQKVTDTTELAYPTAANVECAYNLQPAFDANYLRIETTRFLLSDSIGCQDEYLEIVKVDVIENEVGERLTSIGRWCGSLHAKHVDIMGKVRIHVKIGDTPLENLGNRGYTTYVSTVDESMYRNTDTQVIVTPDPVYIYSPGYPGFYPREVSVRWQLSAADGQVINVEAVEFQVEKSDDSGACTYDSLTFTHLTPDNDTFSWCGRSGSRFLQSQNNLEMVLKTDNGHEERGFALRVYSTAIRNTSCMSSGVRAVTASSTAGLLSIQPPLNDRVICTWLIQAASPNEVIELEVIDWDEDVLRCGDNPLEIHDGPGEEGTRVLSKCGGTSPFGFIRTSGSAVYITSGLVMSRSSQIGFKIKYSSVYKYYYDSKHYNAVRSRSFIWVPELSDRMGRPVLNIRSDAPFYRCVRVEVLTKWLHVIQKSYMDQIDVFDGTTYRARLMGVCAGEDKSSASGSVDTMQIKVKTPVQEGFWMAVDTTGNCDGDEEVLKVTETDQRLVFPTSRMKNNNFYPSNTECTWRLEKSDSAGLLHVDLLHLALSDSTLDRCDGAANYLEAYTGDDSISSKVDTWCDNHLTNVTSMSDLRLKVRVKDFGTARNFTISYRVEPRFDCSGVRLYAKNEWSYLSSPGYPSNYPNNVNCSWELVSVDPDQVVKLEVIEIRTSSCNDYVSVYDGSRHSRLLLEICNDGYVTSSVQSTGQSMYVVFRSDSVNTDRGFRLAYYTFTEESSNRVNLRASSVTQVLNGPGFPAPYEKGTERLWLIQAGSRSAVVILQLNNEADRLPCRNNLDMLRVYDGSHTQAPLLSDFCITRDSRDLARQVQTTMDTALVHLKSAIANVEQTYSGTFSVYYFSGIPQRACKETEELAAVEKWSQLKFPSHAGNYPGDAVCKWRLSAQNYTSTITLEVTRSDLEQSYTCNYDSVTVYDGYGLASRELGVFCGDQEPQYQSTSNFLFIVFKSDKVKERTGFTLRYRLSKPLIHPSTEPPREEASVGLLVGGTLGGISFLLVAIAAFLCILRRAKQSPQRSDSREPVVYNRNNSTVYVVSPVIIGGGSPGTAPPPYPGISNPAYSASPSDELPPAYQEYGGHVYQASRSPSSSDQTAAAIPSPPPYSETPDHEIPESPPAYETAVRSGSPEPDQRTDNSRRPDSQVPRTDARGGNPVQQRSILYEALGPV